MAAPDQLTVAMLSHFFVYNPLFGPTDETEQQKLLFHYPGDLPMDHKLKNVGLSEALVNFTRTFSPDRPCEIVHTVKRRMVFYNPEPNYWMVMYIDQASVRRPSKDDREVVEYLDYDLQDSVLDATIRQVYKMFKLFHSSFDAIVTKQSRQTLTHKLDEFFPPVLARLDMNDIDFMTSLDGIQFLPLDKTLYLRVQSFINLTESSFPDVAYTCFLYSQQLVFSGLEQDDMRILYRYITAGFLLNLPLDTKPPEEAMAAKKRSMRDSLPPRNIDDSRPGFLTGPEDLNDPQAPINIPRVFVGPEGQPHFMIIYQFGEIKVIFFIPVTPTSQASLRDLSFYTALHQFLAPRLQELVARIGQLQVRKPAPEPSFKYIYFNSMNMALKTTLLDGRPTVLSREIMRLLSDLNEEFVRRSDGSSPEQISEIVVKTANDYWVVGKRSEQREFYVVLLKKDATLLDVQEEVKRLSTTQFSSIFMD